MSEKHIIAIDQSTSATKVMLFNARAELQHRVSIAHQQFYPQTGFVEHNAVEIYTNVLDGIKQLQKATGISANDVASIAITNQRETALIWDKTTGLPVGNAAVWQCQRGATMCKEMLATEWKDKIKSKTGLLIDPYFSATKLSWMLKNTPGISAKAKNGELMAGTMDSWLLYKLTGGKVHATDYSNACRTMLFNIHTLQWDTEIIQHLGLESIQLPEVKYSDTIFGTTHLPDIFEQPIPISGLIGDSHGALFGQNCFKTGMAKSTYGTGSSMMMNIGQEAKQAPEGLVTSIGYSCCGQIHYVFEGNIHCTGDTINWLKNEMQLIESASETEPLARSVKDNNGVYLVPAFVGLGAPHWDNEARACLSGMPRNTTKAHIVRAALESIAFQVNDLVALMQGEGGIPLQELRVDGGPTRNSFLMQFQSDVLNRPVVCSEIEEISALGATFLAGLATQVWQNTDEISALKKAGTTYHPAMEEATVKRLNAGWQKAVQRARLT